MMIIIFYNYYAYIFMYIYICICVYIYILYIRNIKKLEGTVANEKREGGRNRSVCGKMNENF